jgi:CRISPR-associated protein Csd2
MEVVKLFWFEHNCKDGQYSSAKVHRSVKVKQKNPDERPSSLDDYEIYVEKLDGLDCQEIENVL